MKCNVLFIMVDSLRADHCWGDRRLCQTPVLDKLQREGVVCTQAFSTASITTTCTTSILTGAYPFVHGINTFVSGRLRPSLPTLAEVFKANGYHTWAEMTGPLEPMTGLDRGFDDYRHRQYTEWLDTDFGDTLIARLKGNQSAPWFGFLHLWEIHYPRRITSRYNLPEYGRNSYERAVSSLDRQLARIFEAVDENTVIVLTGDHGEYLSNSTANAVVTSLKRVTAWLKRRSAVVKKVRFRITRNLVKTMDRLKQRENDMYRAWLGHGFHVYDPLVHVPLIIYGPKLFPSHVQIDSLVSHIDIFPTLVAALGLQYDHSLLNGIDLMPLIRHPGSKHAERALYIQASGARGMVEPHSWLAGVRTEQYKYVRRWSDTTSSEELYDLKHDPAERANLAGKQPSALFAMRCRLDELLQSAPISRDLATTAYTPSELDRLTKRLRDLGYVE